MFLLEDGVEVSGSLVEDPVLVLLDGLALLHLLLPVVGLDRRRVGVLLILQNEYDSVQCDKYVLTGDKTLNKFINQISHLVDLGAVGGGRAHRVVSRRHGASRNPVAPVAHVRHVRVVLLGQEFEELGIDVDKL